MNNFREVNNELIDEMKDEIKKGNYEEVTAIAEDIKAKFRKNKSSWQTSRCHCKRNAATFANKHRAKRTNRY